MSWLNIDDVSTISINKGVNMLPCEQENGKILFYSFVTFVFSLDNHIKC